MRIILDYAGEQPSRWSAVQSIAGKIGCSPHTLLDWVKKADRDAGRAPGIPSDAAAKLKALLSIESQRVFAENFHVYGGRTIWRQLQWGGVTAARYTVRA